MKGRKSIICLITILMLVILPINAFAVTIKIKESNTDSLLLADFQQTIDDVCDVIKKDFSGIEYYEICYRINSALTKATTVNDEGLKIVDLDLFAEKLESEQTCFRKNVIRFYKEIFISAEKDSFIIKRTPYQPLWKWQYDWVFSSSSYSLKLYDQWENRPGDIPNPIGDPDFYAKKVFFENWYGWYKEVDQNGAPNGLGGIIQKVFAIGSLSKSNSIDRSINPFILLLKHFTILEKFQQNLS